MTGLIVMFSSLRYDAFVPGERHERDRITSAASEVPCSHRFAARHLYRANSIPLMRKIAHERGTHGVASLLSCREDKFSGNTQATSIGV